MSGTIVIVNGLAAGSAPQVLARIDGPNGYRVRDNRAGRFDVIPGIYRVRVSWVYYHSNTIKVEVRQGAQHQVAVCPTPVLSLTRIPLIGMLPQLAASMIPGTALRLRVIAPGPE